MNKLVDDHVILQVNGQEQYLVIKVQIPRTRTASPARPLRTNRNPAIRNPKHGSKHSKPRSNKRTSGIPMRKIFRASIHRDGINGFSLEYRDPGKHPTREPLHKRLPRSHRNPRGQRKRHRPIPMHRKPHPPRPPASAHRVPDRRGFVGKGVLHLYMIPRNLFRVDFLSLTVNYEYSKLLNRSLFLYFLVLFNL